MPSSLGRLRPPKIFREVEQVRLRGTRVQFARLPVSVGNFAYRVRRPHPAQSNNMRARCAKVSKLSANRAWTRCAAWSRSMYEVCGVYLRARSRMS